MLNYRKLGFSEDAPWQMYAALKSEFGIQRFLRGQTLNVV